MARRGAPKGCIVAWINLDPWARVADVGYRCPGDTGAGRYRAECHRDGPEIRCRMKGDTSLPALQGSSRRRRRRP